MDPFKAISHDKIHTCFLQYSCDEFRIILLQIFNKIYMSGNIPWQWSSSEILPIPKPGKNLSQPINYIIV